LANVGYLAPLGAAAMGGLSLYRESQKPKERRRYSNALVDAGIGGALGSVPWLVGHLLANGDTETPTPKTWGNLPGRIPGMITGAANTAVHAPGQVMPNGSTAVGAATQPFLYRYLSKGNPDGPSIRAVGGEGGMPGGRLLGGWSQVQGNDASAIVGGKPGIKHNVLGDLQNPAGVKLGPSDRFPVEQALNKMRDSAGAVRNATLAAKHGLPASGTFSWRDRYLPNFNRGGGLYAKPIMLTDAASLEHISKNWQKAPAPTGLLGNLGTASKHLRGLASLAPVIIGAVADNNLLGTKE